MRTRWLWPCGALLVSLVALGASCSSTNGKTDPGVGDAHPIDAPAPGLGETGASGGDAPILVDQAGPASGSEGGPPPDGIGQGPPPDGGSACSGVCPTTAPTGGACDCVSFCRYYECAGRGRVVAVCDGKSWSVTSQPCNDVPCTNNAPCPAGKICVETQSGTVSRECVNNPCGAGPVRCSCAATLCVIGQCMDQGQFGGADLVCSPGGASRPAP